MAERWILTRGDAYYPKCLEDLHSPPRVLYGIGDPTLLSTPMLSVIGARRATPYGIAIAEMTARVAVALPLFPEALWVVILQQE